MTQPTSSYRTTAENRKALSELFRTVSAGTEKAVDGYLIFRPRILATLEGLLSRKKLEAIALSTEQTGFNPVYAANPEVLRVHIDAWGEKNMDLQEFTEIKFQLAEMSDIEIYFLQEEIDRRRKMGGLEEFYEEYAGIF